MLWTWKISTSTGTPEDWEDRAEASIDMLVQFYKKNQDWGRTREVEAEDETRLESDTR